MFLRRIFLPFDSAQKSVKSRVSQPTLNSHSEGVGLPLVFIHGPQTADRRPRARVLEHATRREDDGAREVINIDDLGIGPTGSADQGSTNSTSPQAVWSGAQQTAQLRMRHSCRVMRGVRWLEVSAG